MKLKYYLNDYIFSIIIVFIFILLYNTTAKAEFFVNNTTSPAWANVTLTNVVAGISEPSGLHVGNVFYDGMNDNDRNEYTTSGGDYWSYSNGSSYAQRLGSSFSGSYMIYTPSSNYTIPNPYIRIWMKQNGTNNDGVTLFNTTNISSLFYRLIVSTTSLVLQKNSTGRLTVANAAYPFDIGGYYYAYRNETGVWRIGNDTVSGTWNESAADGSMWTVFTKISLYAQQNANVIGQWDNFSLSNGNVTTGNAVWRIDTGTGNQGNYWNANVTGIDAWSNFYGNVSADNSTYEANNTPRVSLQNNLISLKNRTQWINITLTDNTTMNEITLYEELAGTPTPTPTQTWNPPQYNYTGFFFTPSINNILELDSDLVIKYDTKYINLTSEYIEIKYNDSQILIYNDTIYFGSNIYKIPVQYGSAGMGTSFVCIDINNELFRSDSSCV